MNKLDQHCALCSTKPVQYVKTKGQFIKVCDSCKAVLEKAGLTVEPNQVYAMGKGSRTVWESPSGSLFRGPHGAWKALTATRNACECIDDDAWVCFRGQNIVGMNHCPCLCHRNVAGGKEEG